MVCINVFTSPLNRASERTRKMKRLRSLGGVLTIRLEVRNSAHCKVTWMALHASADKVYACRGLATTAIAASNWYSFPRWPNITRAIGISHFMQFPLKLQPFINRSKVDAGKYGLSNMSCANVHCLRCNRRWLLLRFHFSAQSFTKISEKLTFNFIGCFERSRRFHVARSRRLQLLMAFWYNSQCFRRLID